MVFLIYQRIEVVDSKGNVLSSMGHTYLFGDYFNFYKFFVVMDGICVNSLFQASVFFKGFNGKFAKGFFLQLRFACNVPVFS